jgi:para-nitrobenzyl esterase
VAFGGDSKRVLVFGEAAGAVNVCALLATPRAKGLFSSALMQSGACAALDAQLRDEQGRILADAAGCSGTDVAQCLRSAEAMTLANTLALQAPLLGSWQAAFGPTVDGLVLPQAPLAALESGHAHDVPLAIGSNTDEFALFLADDAMPSCTEYAPYLSQVFGALAPQVEQRYFCDEQKGAAASAIAAVTDALYTCPARRAARAASAVRTAAVYRYLYAHARAYGPLAALRAYHSAELPYLFDTLGVEGYAPTEGEAQLVRTMQNDWSALARGEAPWERFAPARDNVWVIDEAARSENSTQSGECDFWDAVSP